MCTSERKIVFANNQGNPAAAKNRRVYIPPDPPLGLTGTPNMGVNLWGAVSRLSDQSGNQSPVLKRESVRSSMPNVSG